MIQPFPSPLQLSRARSWFRLQADQPARLKAELRTDCAADDREKGATVIEFKCPKCSQALEADYQAAGGKATCFKCNAVVDVPWPDLLPKVQCPACKAELDFPPSAAGMIEKCPKCGCAVQVPGGRGQATSGCGALLGQGLVCVLLLIGAAYLTVGLFQ
jgi:hypothetical protein